MLVGKKGRKELSRKLCEDISTELGKKACRKESMQKKQQVHKQKCKERQEGMPGKQPVTRVECAQ